MNRSLFESWHYLIAAVLAGAFIAWWVVTGLSLGSGPGSSRVYLLGSGLVCLTLFFLVACYALRKYAHKTGLSPEFRMKVRDLERIEKSEQKLNQLRVQILKGKLVNEGEIKQKTRAILAEEGVARINRVLVEPGATGGPKFELRVVPTEPLGRMRKWTHVHLAYGMAAAVVVLLHGAGSFASPMGALLNTLSLIVFVSGLYGVVAWVFGPTWLTEREKDLSSEEAYVLDESLSNKISAAFEGLSDAQRAILKDVSRSDAPGFAERARRAMESLGRSDPDALPRFQDLSALLGQHHRVRRTLRSLNRARYAIHMWKWLHVPAAILLLWAALIHAVSVLWY